jgi:20S proteasome alpha/beta subunit
MTLVLALRCADGVVLASDGQATSDAAGQPTRQPVDKLFALGARIAWGAAGSMGLQQAVGEALAEREALLAGARDPRPLIVDALVPVQQRALRDYVPHPGTQPPDIACIFCWCDPGGRPRIFSVPRTGSDHQLHDGHAAVGTGDIFADFAMASITHLGAPELTLEQAKMVALKTVRDAIDVAAVYLGPPIQMFTVTPGEGARSVPRAEVDGELTDSVDAWKLSQRESLGPLAAPAPALRPARRAS